jgi:Domain of unknown function (DUF4157)
MSRHAALEKRAAVSSATSPSPTLQRKLTIGPSDDPLEHEADRVAEQAVSAPSGRKGGRIAPLIRRSAKGPAAGQAEAPPSVHSVLQSGGTPLQPRLRRDLEARIGHDFSQVRVHRDGAAEKSASDIGALAYTSGNHIVFGRGAYAPGTRAGHALLAHELTHVVQQGGSAPGPGVIRRKGTSPGGFWDNLVRSVQSLFGDEPGYDDTILLDYLKTLDRTDDIEDDQNSDDKARTVVKRWMSGAGGFHLTSRQMVLLIREMGSGFLSGGDRDGIMTLLRHAENGDLRIIFAPGNIDPKQLAARLGDDKALLSFYDTRFAGGQAALYAGKVEPTVRPAGGPVFAWDLAHFRTELANPLFRVDELTAELSRLPEAELDKAFKDLLGEIDDLHRRQIAEADKARAEKDPGKKAAIKTTFDDLEAQQARIEAVVQPIYTSFAKTQSLAVMLSKTRALTAAERAEIPAALKPEVRMVGGKAAKFRQKIPGEKDYDQKVRDFMPTMVQNYWDGIVKGHEAKEHADPTKVHKLSEFDSIANAAKDATDAVFGSYYDAAAHPPYVSDKPGPKGRGQLHDLFADMERDLPKMGAKGRRDLAKTLVLYMYNNNGTINAINRQHDASPDFVDEVPKNDEAKLLGTIADDWVKDPAHVKTLNEIDRNWPASAQPATGEINLQIFKKDTPDEDRAFLWENYQTMIHEYIHTLVHKDYRDFAYSAGGVESNTLMEGVDSFLDEIVWQDARKHVAEPAVRAKVEGDYAKLPFDESLIPSIVDTNRYDAYAEAVKLVRIVGIHNLYAAYFQGKVDLIKP